MTHHEVTFPTNISWGSMGGPGFESNVFRMDSGQVQVVQRRSQSLRVYNAKYGIKSHGDLAAVRDFYLARSGLAHSFNWKDFEDHNSSPVGFLWTSGGTVGTAATNTDQVLGVGDGTTTQFQLVKRYTSGGHTYVRTIRKPVTGTVTIAFNGTNQPSGWSVDTTTGIVTFTSAPSLGVSITTGFDFLVPVMFGDEVDRALQIALESFGHGEIPNIPIVEVLDPSPVDEDFPTGGAKALAMSAHTTLNHAARLWAVTPAAGSLKLILPAIDDFPTGGPLWRIVNDSGSNSFALVEDDTTTSVATFTTGMTAEVWVGLDSGGNKVWRVF